MYSKLGDEGFRALRRKLSLSKMRMDWSSNAARDKLSRTFNDSTGLKC